MPCNFDVNGLDRRIRFHGCRLGFAQAMLAERLNVRFFGRHQVAKKRMVLDSKIKAEFVNLVG